MSHTDRFTPNNWHSIRITVPGGAAPAERLLMEIVRPWTSRALAAGWLGGWFLIRQSQPAAQGTPARLALQFRDTDRRRLSDLAVRIGTFLADQPDEAAVSGDLVVQQAFAPPVDEFGGQHGVAVALAHHVAGTRVALNTIENAPAPEDRIAAAAWLLAASALARGTDRRGAVAWLRHYGRVAEGSGVVDLRSRQAVADPGRGNTSWRRLLLDGAPLAAAAADGDLGTWFRLQHGTWSTLLELRAAGELAVPPDVVFDTLVRTTHDQIGLSPSDDTRTARLMAIALDTATADRRYHLAS